MRRLPTIGAQGGGLRQPVKLKQLSAFPASVPDRGIPVAISDGGETELGFVSDDGDTVQITKDGTVNASALGIVEPNKGGTGRDTSGADNGDVLIFVSSAGDWTEKGWTSDGSITVSSTGAANVSAIITASGVTAPKIASDAVTTNKIAADAVTTAKIADIELKAIASGTTLAADNIILYTGAATASTTTLTSFGRSLIDDATAAAARTTLGLGTGDSPTFTGLTLSGLTANSFLFSGVAGLLTTTVAPTNGQILVGVTEAAPVLGDHGNVAGLADDDHTQYALLAGRAGGQTLVGGTAAGDDLTLRATANATPGDIILEVEPGVTGMQIASTGIVTIPNLSATVLKAMIFSTSAGVLSQLSASGNGLFYRDDQPSGFANGVVAASSVNHPIGFTANSTSTGTLGRSEFLATVNFGAANRNLRMGICGTGATQGLAGAGDGYVETQDFGLNLIVGTRSSGTGHLIFQSNGLRRASIPHGGSFIIGTATAVGATALHVLAIGGSTAPTTQPADMIQAWSADYAGGPGDARLYVWSETGNQIAIGNNRFTFHVNAANEGAITTATLTGDKVWTFPDSSLTVAGQDIDNLFSAAQTFTVDRGILTTNQTSSAGASAGTLANAPAAGDPGFWLKIKVNTVDYAIPCWAG